MTVNHRIVYPLVSLVVIGFVVALWLIDEGTAVSLAVEDGPIETLSAILWALGMVVSGIAIWRRSFVPYAWLWLVICLVCLGEETSWFQRYIGYSVPVVEQASRQSEFNIHNLEIFPYTVTQLLFILGLLAWFLAAPLALLTSRGRSIAARIRFPDPTILFAACMWIPVAFSYLPVAEGHPRAHAVREAREMSYALFVLVYTFGFAVRNTRTFRSWPPVLHLGDAGQRGAARSTGGSELAQS